MTNQNPSSHNTIQFSYRGFSIRPFIRWKPIHIGTTKLYCVGPLAVFIGSAS